MYELTDIPDEFKSDGEGDIFKQCALCSSELTQNQQPYFIEKGYKNYTDDKGKVTLFEFAICMSCRENEYNSLSKESRKKIEEYQQKIKEELEQTAEEVNPADLDEYVVACACVGNQMVKDSNMLMTQEAMDDILSILSVPSQEHLRELTDRLVTLPPELEPLFDGTPKRILI